jgi:hypothetical protein
MPIVETTSPDRSLKGVKIMPELNWKQMLDSGRPDPPVPWFDLILWWYIHYGDNPEGPEPPFPGARIAKEATEILSILAVYSLAREFKDRKFSEQVRRIAGEALTQAVLRIGRGK